MALTPPGTASAAIAQPRTAETTAPTAAPDHVLPGEIDGHSFGPPISRPPN